MVSVSVSCHSERVEYGPTELDEFAGPRENIAQDYFNFSKFLGSDRQRRCQLNDGITAIIGAAIKPRFEECFREEASQELLGLFIVESFLGFLFFTSSIPKK